MIRLLAFRAWGDRDRTWRKRKTAEAIRAQLLRDRRDLDQETMPMLQHVYGFDGIALTEERWSHQRTFVAARGERQAEVTAPDAALFAAESFAHVMLDSLDELDRLLDAGGTSHGLGPHVLLAGPRR